MRRGQNNSNKGAKENHAPVTNAAGLSFQALSGTGLGPNRKTSIGTHEHGKSKEPTAPSSPTPDVASALQVEQTGLFAMSLQPGEHNNNASTTEATEQQHLSLYPRDMGLLKPTGKKNPSGLTSGTHIRRRPPSAAPGHRGSDSHLGGGSSPATAALGDDFQTIAADIDTSNLMGSQNEKRPSREEQKPIAYKRRADPSPAPSRPPRANRRRQLPALTNSPPNAAIGQPQVARRLSSDGIQRQESESALSSSPPRDRAGTGYWGKKAAGRPPSGRRQGSAPAGHSEISALGKGLSKLANSNTVSASGVEREEVLRNYVALCRELNETPRAEWVTALTEGEHSTQGSARVDSLDVSTNPPVQPAKATTGTGLSGRRPRLATKESATTTGTTGKRTKSPATGRTKGTRRTGSVGRVTTANRAQAIGSRPTSIVDTVQQYCDQHLNPYRAKMASVTKQRIGVRQALSKFVSSVQVLISEKNDDGEENTSHRRLSGGQSSGSNSPNATPRGKSRRNSTGSKLGEVGTPAMHRKARVVTNGLREVQTEVGKLLLSLGEYAKESRKPLGTLRSFRASDGAFQPSRGASFDGNNVSVNSAHNVSASGSAPPPLPSIPPLFSNSEPPTPSASPQGFVEFLRQQEGEIAAQLDDLRDTVRRVLAISDVTVDDDRVFSSPLFLCPAKGATAEVGEGAKSPSTPRASGPAKSQVSPRKKDKATPMTPRTKAKKEKEGKASVSSLPPMSARSGAQNALAVVVTVATPTDKDHGKNGVVLKLTSATPRGNRTPRRRGSEPLTPRSVTEKAVKPPTRSASAGAGTGKKKLKRAASASKKKDTSAAATGAPSSSNAPSRGINKSTLKKEKEPKPAADETQIVSPHLLPMTDLLEAKTVWDSIKNKLPVHNTTGTIPSPPKLWKGSDSAPSPKESAARNKSSSDTREMNSGDAVVTQVSATEDEVKVSSPDGKKEEITEDTKQNNAQRVIDLDATAVTDLNVSDILATGAGGESPLPRFPESQAADPPEGAQTPTTGDLEMEMKEDSKETYGDVGKKIQENSTTLPPSMSVSKPRLTGTKEEQAVTLIAACWRRYKAQKEMTFFISDRTNEREMEEEDQYHKVLESRLKRYLLGLMKRRRTRKLIQAAKEKREAEELLAVQTCAVPNRAQSSRDRFQKSKEQRRKIRGESEADTAPNSPPTGTRIATSPYTSPTISSPPPQVVTPLALAANGISTKAIDMYNKDSDTFKLGVIHRLLQAPQTLLYTVRMAVGNFPLRPPMAYAEPKQNHNRADTSLSPEREQTPETERTAAITDIRSEMKKRLDQEHSAKICGRRKSQWKRGVYHLPYSSIRHCMTFQCNLASECARGGVLPPLLATSSSNAGSSSSGSSSKRNERVTVPCTVRYHSYVDPNELAHDMPVSKDFQRPFERWGCAHSLCRRVFTAAAIYAWKLIFSHTPHDDYKQQQLRTDEERHQRLLRVDERNRSILACFCVRSEREWLREASKDLSFVGQIWNPKNSLNPKDPNFEQQCREMFTFVEDFLFQCFPTVNGLDEIPSFLVGAGMYSMLGEVFHVEEEVRAGGSMMEQLKRQSEALNLSNRSELVTNRVRDGSMTSLTAFQQATIHRYELVSLLNRLSSWLLIGNEAEIFNQSVHHANSNDEEQTNMFHPVAPQESIEAQLVRTINDDTKLASSVLGDTMREGTGNNMFATSSPSPADNLQLAVKGESGTFSLYAGGVTPTAPTTSSINFPSALTGHSTPSNRNPPNESKATEDNIANPILVRVPGDFIVANNNNENFNQNTYYVKHARFIKEREEGIYNILVGALKSSGTAVGSTVLQADRDEVTIVYPKKFLTLIAQRLTFELFGLQLNLDICEDLDVVE